MRPNLVLLIHRAASGRRFHVEDRSGRRLVLRIRRVSCDPLIAVEGPLQDVGGGHFVHRVRPLGARGIRVSSVRVTTMVDMRSSQNRTGRGRRGLRLRTKARVAWERGPSCAVHVERQAEDKPADLVAGSEILDASHVGRASPA